MTSITWASLRYVQELAAILGPQNRTQGSCDMQSSALELSKNFRFTHPGEVPYLVLLLLESTSQLP